MIKALDYGLYCDCLQPGCSYCDQDGSRSQGLINSLHQMEFDNMKSWWDLKFFLLNEKEVGVTDFKISFTGERTISIQSFKKNNEKNFDL